MKNLVLPIAFIAVGLLVLGAQRSRGVRVASRVLSFVGLVCFGVIALACLYGMFALGSRGGGVLLFLAVPAGLIALLFGYALVSSLGTEAFAALPQREQLEETRTGIKEEIVQLELRIAEMEARRRRFWIRAETREELRQQIQRSQVQLTGLRAMQAGLQNVEPPSDRKAG